MIALEQMLYGDFQIPVSLRSKKCAGLGHNQQSRAAILVTLLVHVITGREVLDHSMQELKQPSASSPRRSRASQISPLI